MPRTPEWFEARKGKFTASRIAAMCQLDDKGTETYKAMIERVRRGEEREIPKFARSHVFRGNVAEMAVLKEMKRCLGAAIFETGVFARGGVMATPDAVGTFDYMKYFVVEAKCPNTLKKEPPLSYLVQLHVQMYTANASLGYLVMSDRSMTRIWRVTFCRELWEQMIVPGLKRYHRDVTGSHTIGRGLGKKRRHADAMKLLRIGRHVTRAHTDNSSEEVQYAIAIAEARYEYWRH